MAEKSQEPGSAGVWEEVVEISAAGERLDVWLARRAGISRARAQAALREGRVAVEPGPVEAARRLRGAERVRWMPAPRSPQGDLVPEPLALDVVHEDGEFLVVNKPAGMVVHPAAGHWTGTLVHALLHHCGGRLAARGGADRLGIVHRLDKDTSGLMVVAKTDAAHEHLARQFQEREVLKEYEALAKGNFRRQTGTCTEAIGRHPVHRKRMAASVRGGRPARTDYRVVRQWPSAAWVSCRLHTGRTHQIRVHLAHLGHPLLGDTLYGRPARLPEGVPPPPRQMLHAAKLGFWHPQNGRFLEFEAPLPDDFAGMVRALDAETSGPAEKERARAGSLRIRPGGG